MGQRCPRMGRAESLLLGQLYVTLELWFSGLGRDSTHNHRHVRRRRREGPGFQLHGGDQNSCKLRSMHETLLGMVHGWNDMSLTNVLTTSMAPATLLCFPLVMTSHFCPALESQAATWIGVRFARKSPESSSTKRHCPVPV
jgi:hypothetical protein